MPLSTLFALLTVATGAELDQVLAELGALTTIPCVVVGSNSLALTPMPQTPTVAFYDDYQGFSFIALAANTGAVTAAVGGLAPLNVYTDSFGGPALLVGGEIQIGNLFILYYDATLDGGNGGFHLGGPGNLPGAQPAVLVEGGGAEKISDMTAVAVPPPAMPYFVFQVTGDSTQNYKSPAYSALIMPMAAGVQPNIGITSGQNTNPDGNGANVILGASSGTGPSGAGGNAIIQTANAPAAGVMPGNILLVLSTGGTTAGLVCIQNSTGGAVLPTSDPHVLNAIYQDGSGNLKISI